MSITLAYDVTGAYYSKAPAGQQLAGYLTGSDGIAWNASMWRAHPDAVKIDQDASAAVPTADILDVERGAATPAEAPGWVRQALADFASAKAPGQRSPAIYCSASNVTPVVNALISGGVGAGCGLWIANWNLSQAAAVAQVAASMGPFPVIGIQFADEGAYDTDIFSTAWLANRSTAVPRAWVFTAVRNLTLNNFGPHSFAISWASPLGTVPASSGGPGVGFYEIVVCEGGPDLSGPEVASYPRYVAKGRNPESFTGGSLNPHTQYTAAVRARAGDGTHSGPWAKVTFTTPES